MTTFLVNYYQSKRNYSSVRLVVSTSALLTSPSYSSAVVPTGRSAVIESPSVLDDTQYFYGFEVDGVLTSRPRGSFKTLPASPTDISFIVGADRQSGSNSIVYDLIREFSPAIDLFVLPGDIHYQNALSNTTEAQLNSNWTVGLVPSKFGKLVTTIPSIMMWDNHDYLLTPQDGTNAARDIACKVFRERVPGRFAVSGTTDEVDSYYKFGRYVFLVSDLRSMRSENAATDDASKTMMGADQKDRWKTVIADPANADCVFFWVCATPWIDEQAIDGHQGGDSWHFFSTERTELSDWMKLYANGRVFILSGDMHALAYDDGTNADFATGGGLDIRVIHAAPLDHRAIVHVGPFTEGPFITGRTFQQFSHVKCEEISASQIDVTTTGYRVVGSGLSQLMQTTQSVMF